MLLTPRVRFILGPAGSGKTARCLAEIGSELRRAPDGRNLLLLAPKQATYQLERQLLEQAGTSGWTRLQILSFERLSHLILEQTGPLRLLGEDGRVMVLRALLRRHQSRLRVFHSAARLTGFARELSDILRELQRQQAGPSRLEALARDLQKGVLADKLHDLSLLMREYHAWLSAHQLQDVETLPDLAAEVLRQPGSAFDLEGLWLDGFAEMTPQEIDLLGVLVSRARRAVLAFCADREFDTDAPWTSTWAVVSQTLRRVQLRMAALPRCDLEFELLRRGAGSGRFAGQRALAHLEQSWAAPTPFKGDTTDSVTQAIRMVACPDEEVEAIMAAREICRAVREGLRFRDIAVIVRSLDGSSATLQRTFARYGIPFFTDRRSPLAHHPLAEMTRCALRLAAFGWTHEDWFGVLKTGLTHACPDTVDRLENEALARGWDGGFWLGALTAQPTESAALNRQIRELVVPFERCARALGHQPDAAELTAGIRRLWQDLDVLASLQAWSEAALRADPKSASVHPAAYEQIAGWLDNLARGFAGERLPLGEWLPILDAGLATLSAGVIPPAQDQVLIGAIDRSRQPDLRLALVVGLNEGRFPASQLPAGLLTDSERDQLSERAMLPEWRRRIGHERYYGYIAFTRARCRLVLTWSERDEAGRPLNRSPFVSHLQRVFPSIAVEHATAELPTPDADPSFLAARLEHPVELVPWLLRHPALEGSGFHHDLADALPHLATAPLAIHQGAAIGLPESLHPACARALFGPEPAISVSALESMAACPFQFFVRHALRAQERARFELDPRQTGSLAHELLAAFHNSITSENLRWRDLTPEQARERFDRVVARHPDMATGAGPFAATPEARWRARGLLSRLRELAALLVQWAAGSDFDPAFAEVNLSGAPGWEPWRVEVSPNQWIRVRAKVDRVDLFIPETGGPPSFIVIDYKLASRRLDDVLMLNGVDLQLAAYALALQATQQWTSVADLPPQQPVPAGMFYLGLTGLPKRSRSRANLPLPGAARAALHVHRGRFRVSALPHLDRGASESPSGQYLFKLRKGGGVQRGGDGRPDAEFESLLATASDTIRRLGLRIVQGDVAVSPFRHKGRNACENCILSAICRFDPWVQSFRGLEGCRETS
jgi:ATP-dependent helicase/nuclease subunit B